MSAKKKGPGKGRGPAIRPPSPAKRTTVPKAAAAKPPAPHDKAGPAASPSAANAGKASSTGKAAATAGKASAAAKAAASDKASASGSASAAGKAPAAAKAEGSGKAAPGVPSAKGAAAQPAAGAKGVASAKAGSSAKGTPRGGPTREERLAAAEASLRRRAIRNKALLAAGVVVVMFVVSFVIVSDRRERDKEAAQFQTGSCQFDRKSDGDDGSGRNHVPNPAYKVNPPAGGNHTPQAAPAGIYTAADTPVDGQIVHAMEHGYIVFWYRPDLDTKSLTALRELAQKHQGQVLMVPRGSLPKPVAVTSWHARILCGAFDTDATERFVTTFLNQGPEKGFIK